MSLSAYYALRTRRTGKWGSCKQLPPFCHVEWYLQKVFLSVRTHGRMEHKQVDFYLSDEQNMIRKICSWIVDVVVALAFAWFCLMFFGTQVTVNGQSMYPLLNSGDVVLMNRLTYEIGKPDRMDVVVFEREDQKTNVKRVVAVPGDVVQIIDGKLYVNQEQVSLPGDRKISLSGLAENPVQLEDKEFFLLGDNPDSSEDSRFANIGNVREDQIIGKVWLRMFPLIHISLIRS